MLRFARLNDIMSPPLHTPCTYIHNIIITSELVPLGTYGVPSNSSNYLGILYIDIVCTSLSLLRLPSCH